MLLLFLYVRLGTLRGQTTLVAYRYQVPKDLIIYMSSQGSSYCTEKSFLYVATKALRIGNPYISWKEVNK